MPSKFIDIIVKTPVYSLAPKIHNQYIKYLRILALLIEVA